MSWGGTLRVGVPPPQPRHGHPGLGAPSLAIMAPGQPGVGESPSHCHFFFFPLFPLFCRQKRDSETSE